MFCGGLLELCAFGVLAAPCSASSLEFVFIEELHYATFSMRASSSAEPIRIEKVFLLYCHLTIISLVFLQW